MPAPALAHAATVAAPVAALRLSGTGLLAVPGQHRSTQREARRAADDEAALTRAVC